MAIQTRQYTPDSAQLTLFPKNFNAIGRFAPQAERIESRAVSAVRNLILSKARKYYENMKLEFEHKYLKPRDIQAAMHGWPEGENWEWPYKSMHQKLRVRIKYEADRLGHLYQPDKRTCLRWAEYDREMIERLGQLDELLRTGDLDSFFKIYDSQKGVFWTKEKIMAEEQHRSRLDAHWPAETTAFLTLRLEWKQKNDRPPF